MKNIFEEDKSKLLEILSALQSISLNSKKKSQPGSPASTFYDAYCEISVSRTQALDETYERQTPAFSGYEFETWKFQKLWRF